MAGPCPPSFGQCLKECTFFLKKPSLVICTMHYACYLHALHCVVRTVASVACILYAKCIRLYCVQPYFTKMICQICILPKKNSALCPGVARTSGKCYLAVYYSLNFKWKGSANNFYIRKYTADACVGLARLPKSWVLRRRDGRLRQSWPRISSWETRCLSEELVLRVMPRTFHLLLGPARIPSGTDCTLVGRVQSAHKSTR